MTDDFTLRCEWCGTKLTGGATCGAAHRGARWRWLKGISDEPPPWPESPLHGRHGDDAEGAGELAQAERELEAARAAAATAAERAAELERQQAATHPRSGANARSGLILSYPKARKALVERLGHFPDAERLIDEALRSALSTKMREKLEARS